MSLIGPLDDDQYAPEDIHERRGSVGETSGLKPAQKLDPIWVVGGESMKDGGPHYTTHWHRGSIGGGSGLQPSEKLDPPDIMTTDSKANSRFVGETAKNDTRSEPRDDQCCGGQIPVKPSKVATNAEGEPDCCACQNTTT